MKLEGSNGQLVQLSTPRTKAKHTLKLEARCVAKTPSTFRLQGWRDAANLGAIAAIGVDLDGGGPLVDITSDRPIEPSDVLHVEGPTPALGQVDRWTVPEGYRGNFHLLTFEWTDSTGKTHILIAKGGLI